MRAPESFIGHQVKELIQMHNTNFLYGFRIFRLQGAEDNTGIHILDDFTVWSACDRVPSIADSWIISAEDYYGQFILRIRSRRR